MYMQLMKYHLLL
ncbi:Protein of unknown function [Bacillus cereus]|nr:Protein of unknown function [Bacillus cereus]SCN31626.1 Protein of unknown function [Bacillus wiedmannii]